MATITQPIQNGTTSITINGDNVAIDQNSTDEMATQTVTVTARHPDNPACTKTVNIVLNICPASGYQVTYDVGNGEQTLPV